MICPVLWYMRWREKYVLKFTPVNWMRCDGMSTAKGDVVVSNDAGMHLRPAAAFVHMANKHKGCEIFVASNGQRVNGKSIMGLVMLAASQGTPRTIECIGDGSEAALEELMDLVNTKFGTES